MFGVDETEYQFLNLDLGNAEIYNAIKSVLENSKIEKIVYDAKSLMHYLVQLDIKLNNFYDVSLAYYVLGINDKDLDFNTIISKHNLST